MKIEIISAAKLRPYEKNAKKHPEKQIRLLAENIRRFGFTTPILVDKDDVIIAGHGRLIAGKMAGMVEFPCVRMEHLSPEEVRALRLADNKIAEMGEWDMELVVPELEELSQELSQLTGFRLADLGAGESENESEFVPVIRVYVDCEDETMQEKVFNDIQELGYEPKVINV